MRLLLVDNEDCFIHTLANYARQTGAEVMTYRAGFPLELIEQAAPSLILVSPGPGRPEDFGVPALIRHAAKLEIPVFGVCLGLQGMVEAFGGELGVLDYPMHGKPSLVRHRGVGVFEGLPEEFRVGRYHSLYAIREKLPGCARNHRRKRGRHHHGRPPSRPADGSGAVSSRIDPDAGRKLRPEADGKRGARTGAIAGSRGRSLGRTGA